MYTASDEHEALRLQIHDSLRRAQARRDGLKHTNTRYGVLNVTLAALATFVAGLSTVSGVPLFGDDWRFTCGVAAVLTLGATVIAGLQKQLADPESLNAASECVGKLRSLEIEASPRTYDVEAVRERYKGILTDFSSLDL